MVQGKEQIKQHEMREEDKILLLLDLKDPEAYYQISEIKKKYSKLILVTLILMKFSVFMTQYISNYQNNDSMGKLNQSNQQWANAVIFIFGYFFCQIIIGFMTDLYSVQGSWIFTWLLSSLCILATIWRYYQDSVSIGLFQKILVACARCCIYVIGTNLIFDTSYELNVRFNYSVLFIIISSFLSQYIFLGIDIFAGEYQDDVFKIMLIICFFLSLICGLTVFIAYGKIEKVKENSSAYQRYIRHRGIGLTFKAIRYFYSNKNMLFLFVVTIATSLFQRNDPQYLLAILKQKNDGFAYDGEFPTVFLQSQNLGNIFITYFILKKINKSERLIESYYLNLKYIICMCLIVQLYAIGFIGLSEFIPGDLLAIIFIVIQVYQGYVGIAVLNITNQINYCLQNEKSQIKCIGIGILGFFQDLPSLFFLIPTNTKNTVIASYGSQAGITLLCAIFVFLYLRNKQFDQLEHQIQEQYFTKNTIIKYSPIHLKIKLLNEDLQEQPNNTIDQITFSGTKHSLTDQSSQS